jgi:hypothetical protein
MGQTGSAPKKRFRGVRVFGVRRLGAAFDFKPVDCIRGQPRSSGLAYGQMQAAIQVVQPQDWKIAQAGRK